MLIGCCCCTYGTRSNNCQPQQRWSSEPTISKTITITPTITMGDAPYLHTNRFMAGEGGHSTSGERELAGSVREAPPGRLAPGHAQADELRGDHHHSAKVRRGRKQTCPECLRLRRGALNVPFFAFSEGVNGRRERGRGSVAKPATTGFYLMGRVFQGQGCMASFLGGRPGWCWHPMAPFGTMFAFFSPATARTEHGGLLVVWSGCMRQTRGGRVFGLLCNIRFDKRRIAYITTLLSGLVYTPGSGTNVCCRYCM